MRLSRSVRARSDAAMEGRARAVAAIAAAIVVAGGPASARTVLCFGDSTSWRYPARLQARRPDLRVVNGALPGDVSTSVPRLRMLLDRDRPDDVVVMIGTNDVVRRPDGRAVVTDDPAVTFRNVVRLARLARRRGARVIVLTQTPASCVSCAPRQTHTREVAHRLIAWSLRRPRGIDVADLRDEFTIHAWSTLSDDGLHPNAAGADLIAAFVADRLPERVYSEHTSTTATVRIAR
ncbi:MAG TPA: SGNH/GDSL hydrolase family protein [Candidatus Eisenbacteria bacterium]|nr:SGNH/GDSL hydrolase family protein [Candidatus Eisenbacteria bacterium]